MKLSLIAFDYPILSLSMEEFELEHSKKISFKVKHEEIHIENLTESEKEKLLQYYRDFMLRTKIANETKYIKELIVQRALYDIIYNKEN